MLGLLFGWDCGERDLCCEDGEPGDREGGGPVAGDRLTDYLGFVTGGCAGCECWWRITPWIRNCDGLGL